MEEFVAVAWLSEELRSRRMSELAFFRIHVVELKMARFISRIDNILFAIDNVIHVI